MILRRLAAALRRHDWSLVVIELAIVVAGIFIGLRVDDWSTERKQAVDEARYLQLLRGDVETMLAETRELADQTEENREVTLEALLHLQRGETGPEAAAAVAEAVWVYQLSPPFRFRRATYDEMVATGALARLDDPELRRLLSTTFADLELARANVDRFRVSLPVVDAVVWARVGMSVDEDGRVRISPDMERLADDVEFRNAMVEMLDIHYDVGTVYARVEPLLADLLRLMEGDDG